MLQFIYKSNLYRNWIFRTEYFFPGTENETHWSNSSSAGNLTGGEPYLIVIGTALRTNKHYYKVWKEVFLVLINWLFTPDIHDLHEHGVERASTFVQPRHPQQPHLQQTQVKHKEHLNNTTGGLLHHLIFFLFSSSSTYNFVALSSGLWFCSAS